MKIFDLLFSCLIIFSHTILAQDKSYEAPGNNNPVIPGFFADPSFVAMDGKYYIYATTVSKFMEPVVWVSDDMVTWDVHHLGIAGEHFFWAPSVLKGKNGKYYLYHTSGFDFKCHLYIGETPTGPWEKFGFVEEGFDLQIYEDPATGKVYGLSSDPQSRPRIVEFESNPNDPGYLTKVIHEASPKGPFFDYTEGSFIVYRDGWYYLMYSGGKCGDVTYNIRYARSRDIYGPYTDAPGYAILEQAPGKNIYGTGHHSVFMLNDAYYIVYHRQDKYNAPTCSERMVCIDKMEFDADGYIKKVTPTNAGIDFSEITGAEKPVNLALGKETTSSGNAKGFEPGFAVDGNFSTRWMHGNSGSFSVDLGGVFNVERIVPYFLYYDYFNLYRIKTSLDNQNWDLYFDQSKIARKGAAPVLPKKAKARYVKVEFVRGPSAASLCEFEVYGTPTQ